jgi:hypothetical protein
MGQRRSPPELSEERELTIPGANWVARRGRDRAWTLFKLPKPEPMCGIVGKEANQHQVPN